MTAHSIIENIVRGMSGPNVKINQAKLLKMGNEILKYELKE